MSSARSAGKVRRYRLGKYEVRAHIASGGMGAVYRAVDTETGREVALKVLPPEYAARPNVLERFRREFSAGTKLRHENIATLYDFEEVAGTHFLVMEFVDGINLYQHICSRGRLEPEEARAILIQAARGLEHAHRCDIIHRDIKPSNIILTETEGRLLAKLIDFGLARETREDEFRITRDGTTVGTVDYLAPEQARDSRSADIRSDIYALGCTLYHMLAGKPPFNEGTLIERIFKHTEAEPPDLRRTNPDIPADLLAICRRMMAKKPADRYQTPTELLRELLGEKPEPKPVRREAEASPRAPAAARDTVMVLSAASTATSLELGADSSPASQEQRQAASGQFQRASQVMAEGNMEYARELLLVCCRLDPTNLLYRHALRQAHPGRPARGGLRRLRDWVRSLGLLVRFYKARALNQHLEVVNLGEALVSRDPGNISIQLDMAAAADAAGFNNLSIWLLDQAKLKDEQHVRVNRALASLLERKQDYARALAYWALVAKGDPASLEAQQKIKELAARDTISRGRYEDRL
jgi:serine/threonine protein kinase